MRFFPNKPWYFQSFFEIICSVLLVWLHLKLGLLGLQICKIMPNDWLLLHGLCNLITWKGDSNVPFQQLIYNDRYRLLKIFFNIKVWFYSTLIVLKFSLNAFRSDNMDRQTQAAATIILSFEFYYMLLKPCT